MHQVEIATFGASFFGKSFVVKLNYIVIFSMNHHYTVVLRHLFHRQLDTAKIQSQARAFRMSWQHICCKDFETRKSLFDYIAELIEYLKRQCSHQSYVE